MRVKLYVDEVYDHSKNTWSGANSCTQSEIICTIQRISWTVSLSWRVLIIAVRFLPQYGRNGTVGHVGADDRSTG